MDHRGFSEGVVLGVVLMPAGARLRALRLNFRLRDLVCPRSTHRSRAAQQGCALVPTRDKPCGSGASRHHRRKGCRHTWLFFLAYIIFDPRSHAWARGKIMQGSSLNLKPAKNKLALGQLPRPKKGHASSLDAEPGARPKNNWQWRKGSRQWRLVICLSGPSA